jgi:hypothetical protein
MDSVTVYGVSPRPSCGEFIDPAAFSSGCDSSLASWFLSDEPPTAVGQLLIN